MLRSESCARRLCTGAMSLCAQNLRPAPHVGSSFPAHPKLPDNPPEEGWGDGRSRAQEGERQGGGGERVKWFREMAWAALEIRGALRREGGRGVTRGCPAHPRGGWAPGVGRGHVRRARAARGALRRRRAALYAAGGRGEAGAVAVRLEARADGFEQPETELLRVFVPLRRGERCSVVGEIRSSRDQRVMLLKRGGVGRREK
jgi:hypothetical protein